MNKPLASMSLDLDDQWSYMKVHGDDGWDLYPSYLDIVVPFFLDLLDEMDIKITFFIVGQDAVFEKNQKILKSIIDRGHEIGNHSFHHESWLKTYTKEKIEKEIILAEDAILKATGQKTRCFRGPGFSWSNDLLEVLAKRDYIFDASILPTYISPLMRRYYFWKSKLSKEERESRKELFGSFKEGFYSLKPFNWKLENGSSLLEIPVTTIPVFKIPFHLSYLIFISGFSMLLMKAYLNFSLLMCKITKTSPSILLHPLDLISGDKVPQLAFFPGMNLPTEKKIDVFKYTLNRIKKDFEVLPMLNFADGLIRQKLNIKDVPAGKS
ncbi:polysaccharide deacetylase family protein [Lutimonas vermicola]|uniref:Polysaccharide deacetylase family protein n=1 Tax=Lutimonas vermicola TaxID=414288 RepID=A0ABU9L3Z2_9FLAO